MALFLIGGLALAVFCIADNRPAIEQPQAVAVRPGQITPEMPPDAPPLPKLPPASLSAAEQLKVDRAIADGVWYLRDTARPDGGWGPNNAEDNVGFACLPALALLECGVPPSDPVIQNAARAVRAGLEHLPPRYENYQRSLAILFLDRLGEERDRELIQYLTLALMLSQHPTEGAWTYGGPAPERKRVPQLLRILKDPTDTYASGTPSKSDVQLFKEFRDEKQFMPAWRKLALDGRSFEPRAWDNSNTQFAILALWVAQRHGVAVERSIALVEHHFRTTQLALGVDPEGHNLNLEGSWYYDRSRNSSRWPSMTCSGLLGLAAAHGAAKAPKEKNQRPLDDPAIQKGLAMLAREIDRKDEVRPPDYYFLWSLERVGVLFNLTKIDGKDWYAWGCKILLPLQKNGGWSDGGYYGSNPALDTAFVLLFLKRANFVQSLTDKLELLARIVRPACSRRRRGRIKALRIRAGHVEFVRRR